MKILMITHGSRGDVQPFAALAEALVQAGHESTLIAPEASAWLAKPFCSQVFEVHDGPNVLASDVDVVAGFEAKFHGLRGKRELVKTARKTRRLVRTFLDEIAEIAHELRNSADRFDILVYHVSIPGHDIAEFLGIPSVVTCPQAYWVPTRTFPDPSFPYRLPQVFNRLSYITSPTILWAFAGSASKWRKAQLGLTRRRFGKLRQADGTPTTVLYAFSKRLLPPAAVYPPSVHTTGFWFLNTSGDWTPPRTLISFLADGPAPVYVGFASSVVSEPHRLAQTIEGAVRRAGARAVVVGGWSGVTAQDFGRDILFVDEAPLDWLFSRVAAVVHHGGLGTTGTALISGRPQVLCPSFPDQWFNARRMHSLGVAPMPVGLRRLRVDNLGEAIRQAICDPRMAAAAEELAPQVRNESGASAAVDVLESLVQGVHRRLS